MIPNNLKIIIIVSFVVAVVCWSIYAFITLSFSLCRLEPDRVAQSVGHLTRKSEVLGSIPCLATYCQFDFR